MFTEAETMAWRSLPDRGDLANKMKSLIKDRKKLESLSKEARKCAEQKHDWSITSNRLMDIVDSLKLSDRSETWDVGPKSKPLTMERPPAKISNEDFVNWCYLNILNRKADEKGFNDWINSLKSGTPREQVEAFFRNEIESFNVFENIRWENSLKLRNIPKPVVKESRSNTIPGVMV